MPAADAAAPSSALPPGGACEGAFVVWPAAAATTKQAPMNRHQPWQPHPVSLPGGL